MPSTAALQVFLNKDRLQPDDWIELIERRRANLAPHFEQFTLPKLGGMRCLKSEGHPLEIASGHAVPKIEGESPFTLQTQGIYFAQAWGAQTAITTTRLGEVQVDVYLKEQAANPCFAGPHHYCGVRNCLPPLGQVERGRRMAIAGLTRDNAWLLASLTYRNEAGYKDRGLERAISIAIQPSSLEEILAAPGFKPFEIWHRLGQVGNEWRQAALQRFQTLDQLAHVMFAEDAAYYEHDQLQRLLAEEAEAPASDADTEERGILATCSS